MPQKFVKPENSSPPPMKTARAINGRQTSKLPSVPIALEGQIVSPLSVSPASLFVGVLKPGQMVTKQLVVRAKKPFKIMGISGGNESLSFKTPEESKPVHLVPVTFTAGKEAGEFEYTIEIETDLATGGKVTSVVRGSVETGEETAAKE